MFSHLQYVVSKLEQLAFDAIIIKRIKNKAISCGGWLYFYGRKFDYLYENDMKSGNNPDDYSLSAMRLVGAFVGYGYLMITHCKRLHNHL